MVATRGEHTLLLSSDGIAVAWFRSSRNFLGELSTYTMKIVNGSIQKERREYDIRIHLVTKRSQFGSGHPALTAELLLILSCDYFPSRCVLHTTVCL